MSQLLLSSRVLIGIIDVKCKGIWWRVRKTNLKKQNKTCLKRMNYIYQTILINHRRAKKVIFTFNILFLKPYNCCHCVQQSFVTLSWVGNTFSILSRIAAERIECIISYRILLEGKNASLEFSYSVFAHAKWQVSVLRMGW